MAGTFLSQIRFPRRIRASFTFRSCSGCISYEVRGVDSGNPTHRLIRIETGRRNPAAPSPRRRYMKRFLAIALVVGVALSAIALADDAKMGGKKMSGTISKVDNDQKMMVVKDKSG